MRRRWMLILNGLFMASGCIYHVQERVDQVTCGLANHPFDVAPEMPLPKATTQVKPGDSPTVPAKTAPTQTYDIQTTAYMQQEPAPRTLGQPNRNANRLRIPGEIPGAETPPIVLSPPQDRAVRRAEIDKLYPALPPLPIEPQALPGPMVSLHPGRLSADRCPENPAAKQGRVRRRAARGNLIQAACRIRPWVSKRIRQRRRHGGGAGLLRRAEHFDGRKNQAKTAASRRTWIT